MLVIVVPAPKAPVPEVFVTVIPTNKPAVDEIPVMGVMNFPSTSGAPVERIVPEVVAVETKDLLVIFGLGFCPHPRAIKDAYAGASPMRYFAIMFLPILVIILYSYVFYYTSRRYFNFYLFV